MNNAASQQDSALVLVVDDDKFMRLQLRRAMEQAGYQVEEAADGEQALSAYTRFQPDIILLDAVMPVMDGFDCCRQLQTLPGGDRTPVLMTTKLEDPESVDLAFDAGATDFITKPIHWAVLRQRVRRLLQASRAMEELRQQTERSQLGEEKLRLALAAARMGTWNWDLQSGKITWSANLEPLFGLAPGSFDGTYQSFIDRVHPEDREVVNEAVRHTVEEGAEYRVEFRVVYPDGRIRWSASQGRVYYDDGKPVRITGIDGDITTRKQLEQERDRFFTLSLDLLCIADFNGYFKRINPVWEKTLGYTEAELLAEPFLHFVHPEDLDATVAEMEQLKNDVSVINFENRYSCKDGTYRWLSWKAFPFVEAGLIYAIARDITEQKRTEQERLQLLALEQAARSEAETARNRIRSILESITDGFFALDREWRFTYINSQAEQLLQRTRTQLLGKNLWDEFPAAVNTTFFEQYQRAVAQQVSVEFEEFYPPPLNTWFAVHAYPSATGLSVYFQDITERKRTAEILQQTTRLQRAILNSANYTIISTDVDGTILTFNAAAERLLGYAASEVIGKTTPKFIHDWEEVVERSQQLTQELGISIEPGFETFVAKARRGELDEREWTYIRKDGSRFPVLLSITALQDPQGKVTGFLGIGSDITERKQAEKELQRQNLRSQLFADITLKIRQSLQIDEILQATVTEVQKLLQADRVLIFHIRPDGYGKIVNEAVVPGWPSVLGRGFTDDCFSAEYLKTYTQGRIYTIADVDKVGVEACLVDFLQEFGVKAKLVMPILLKQELWGLLIAHQCSSSRHWSSSEIELLRQIADQIGIALAQAQMLAEETRQRQELARSNAELQQFASVASHDLQEPLRKIQAFGNRLKVICGEQLTAQGQDYLERMQSAAQRMQALIDDLLTLSRITTRGQPFVTVDLNLIVQEVLSDLELQIQQSNGHVEVGEMPTIEADLVQMRQLLQNLLSNALKFHRPEQPPTVKIYSQLLNQEQPTDSQENATSCRIFVADNGIGFEEKYLDRIFNVFQRLHSRSEYEGTGMGLAICRKIAERHGGSITANSKFGQGSIFIVTIPIKQRRGENLE